MRDGTWKVIVKHPKAQPGSFDNEQVELFNLNDDPKEQVDVSKANPEKTHKLLSQLKTWYADTQKTATAQPGQQGLYIGH